MSVKIWNDLHEHLERDTTRYPFLLRQKVENPVIVLDFEILYRSLVITEKGVGQSVLFTNAL